MKYSSTVLAAGLASVAYAQHNGNTTSSHSAEGEYLTEVCLPLNSTGYPDYNAPCNAMLAIQYQCAFGPEQGLALINSVFGPNADSSSDDFPVPQERDNSTQRACVCSSQFFSQVTGCLACQKGHGDSSAEGVTPQYLSSISSQYCAASVTPTAALADYLANIAEPTSTNTATSSFSDPIGNKTAVSYYWTPSVTGTAAYLIPTSTGALSTSDGQIKPTATVNNAAGTSDNGGAAGTSTSSRGAAAQTQAAAMAGVIGLAGFVALL